MVDGQVKSIWIPDLIEGTYTLFLIGSGNGSYEVESYFWDAAGGLGGFAAGGETHEAGTAAMAVSVSTNDANATVTKPMLAAPLQIGVANDKVQTRWPVQLLGASLERSFDLVSWMAVTNLPAVEGENRLVEFQLASQQSFFRLKMDSDTNLAFLGLTLSDSPRPVPVGSNINYVLGVTNFGPYVASDVKLTNYLPAGVVFVGASSSTGQYGMVRP